MVLPVSTKVVLHITSIAILIGCWHGAVDEEVPSEQGVSVGTSTQKPCEICSSLLEDILHLAEHSGTHPEHKLCPPTAAA